MARTGVQFLDIEKAALELQGIGKIPTVDGVREILGTGSKTTISKHLRAWRVKQTEVEGSLPHELAALVTGLWRKLHTEADQRIEEIEADHQKQRQEHSQTLTQLHQTQSELKKQLHHHEEMAATECSAKENLSKQLQKKQLEYIQSHEQSQGVTRQLEASQAENTRLHQLTQHIQANLEHYQQEMHQHQLKQSMQTEKQLAFYTQEISVLKQQLHSQYNQLKPLERENEKLSTTLDQLENQHQRLQSQFETMQQQLQDVNDQKNNLIERNKVTCETLGSVQNKLDSVSEQRRELEIKMAVLSAHNERLQKDLSQTQDKVETLRQEKLFLIQEKSQLDGFIKKMELNV